MVEEIVSHETAVRRAGLQDLAALHALIRHYSEKGILLPRNEDDLQQVIHEFRVIATPTDLLACGILHLYTPRIGELRSLAVVPGAQGSGLGRRLVEALLEEARQTGLHMVFAFTYATEFFAKLGFEPIDRSLLPWKVWNDCVCCPKRHCCDEIAVARWLEPPRPPSHLVVITS